eukprot:scaffold12159_cov86-Skeletonema_dohrnii-CCMP3373.AAC.6
MADDGDEVFVYTGGEQVVPNDVTHVIIDRSVKIIPTRAFYGRKRLVAVETHDDLERIGQLAFLSCTSLKGIKLIGVKVIERMAFHICADLSDVEFGDKLDTIQEDVELPKGVERIEQFAFYCCPSLRRIAIPLKADLFQLGSMVNRFTIFDACDDLKTVDLVGDEWIHKTISSLLLEKWRNVMNQKINYINQTLPNTIPSGKTDKIQYWIRSVIDKLEHYKVEHNRLLKEDMTQLELALWKAKLDEKEEDSQLKCQAKRAKVDVESMRREKRIMSGASIVIKNVLPFLKLG